MRQSIRRGAEPLAKLKRCEVWIERRYSHSQNHQLMARMVEWTGDELEQVPVFGRCLLSPNFVTDIEMAKTLVKRYLEKLTDDIVFVVRV